ncbi:GGDEF domain-containing protein [Rhodoferax sp. PAMC 29310]|uniref:GGDEF domain-containing protein n=1 Tax=Rhodoferax sp. PAMC 29310 TaxID=2822760 RepID=UPI001B33036D|nr:GGDEF domain-containing protein [Rhodoferax sp. PAMC 29310]
MANPSVRLPWLVRTNYRMRVAAFLSLFLAGTLHMAPSGQDLTQWAVVGTLLFAYPQVRYLRARYGADAMKSEYLSIQMDSVVVGVFVAAVHFSLWLAFSAVLGVVISSVSNRGWRCLLTTLPGIVVGAIAMAGVGGLHVSLPTSGAATVLSMVGIGGYLLSVSQFSFRRNLALRKAREDIQLREVEVLATNQALQDKLGEIRALQQKLEEQAHLDGLTGLYNRRYLDQALKREVARCTRDGQPLAFIMVDVDDFKKYNDSFGHPAGDVCLKQIAACLQSFTNRATDMAARYGGEEFSLMFANTDAASALRIAQQLRLSIES